MGAAVNSNYLVFAGTSKYTSKITAVAIYGVEGEGGFKKKKTVCFNLVTFFFLTETIGITVTALYPQWGEELQVF